MMIEASPPSAFIMADPEFLLELAIIAFDPPSHFCHENEFLYCHRI